MKYKITEPPRQFEVGFEHKVQIKDVAHIHLESDEQVTFVGQGKTEYDVVCKSWGYYATPSLNSRLPRYGLTPLLVRNRMAHYFVVLVKVGSEKLFEEYVALEQLQVIANLTDSTHLEAMSKSLGNK